MGRDGDAHPPDHMLGRPAAPTHPGRVCSPVRRGVDEVAEREAQRDAAAEQLVEVFGG
jgi:hypothetical protein